MISLSAYLLVSHGSRDCRPQIALERLAYLVQQQLNRLGCETRSRLDQDTELIRAAQPSYKAEVDQIATNTATIIKKPSSYWVETATLELAPYPLHEKIQQVAKQVQQAGGKHIKIVPLFLLPGVHVTEDIGEQMVIAQQSLGNSIQLELCPYLGSYPQLTQLLATQFSQLSAPGRILLSHGSRRPGANQLIEKIASQLEAKAAYWSVTPSLAEQIAVLADSGVKMMAIVPYFMFRGAITDAIAQQVQEFQSTYPFLQLQLGSPLEATPELANLIAEFNF